MELSEMIDEFKQNDHSNFNLFYELTHKQVFFSSFTILKEQTLAEDIMQDTYVTFLNNIGDVKSSQNIYAYLSTIARNLSINYYKKMKRNLKVWGFSKSKPGAVQLICDILNDPSTSVREKVMSTGV